MGKVRIMGILNITPDSFSDGGQLGNRDEIVRRIEEMVEAGVDIFDVGGESTRPFADPVPEQEELDRVLPVIERIRQVSEKPISIDTTKAAVAAAALAAGAEIVNDISALQQDPGMLEVVKEVPGQVIIMHMQGTPGNMQVNPQYDDVVADIFHFFEERIELLTARGIDKARIIIDPGIGFGKTVEHNLKILRNIGEFKKLECPVLIGHSRKSFLGSTLGLDITRRDCATAILSFYCIRQGADILRVHDAELTRQAVRLQQLLEAGEDDQPSC
ncbi:MAG: dihydropteroate synthase [Desulfobulbaceae bacterium]|nr:dihydropteroate synthase [Desulfobulbaceae bacterium]